MQTGDEHVLNVFVLSRDAYACACYPPIQLYSTSKGAINDMVAVAGTKVEHIFGSKKSDFSQSAIQAAKDLNDTTLTYVYADSTMTRVCGVRMKLAVACM